MVIKLKGQEIKRSTDLEVVLLVVPFWWRVKKSHETMEKKHISFELGDRGMIFWGSLNLPKKRVVNIANQ